MDVVNMGVAASFVVIVGGEKLVKCEEEESVE